MFGALNGVRTGLVAAATVTMLVAAVLGQWLAAGVLLMGILAHGGLWWWLYRQHQLRRTT